MNTIVFAIVSTMWDFDARQSVICDASTDLPTRRRVHVQPAAVPPPAKVSLEECVRLSPLLKASCVSSRISHSSRALARALYPVHVHGDVAAVRQSVERRREEPDDSRYVPDIPDPDEARVCTGLFFPWHCK